MNLWQDDMTAFVPAVTLVKRAEHGFERLGHFRLRHDFFCREQGLFEVTDRDAIDDRAIPLVAVSCTLGDLDEVVGTVRIHEEAPGTWRGSRLCVARGLRGASSLGGALIRFAVDTAVAEGCTLFLAHVQMQNVRLFERLGWVVEDHLELHGRPHARMRAPLGAERLAAGVPASIVHLARLPDARSVA